MSCVEDITDDNNPYVIWYDDCYPVIVDIMLAHELIPASNLIIAVVRRVDIVDTCVLSACSAVGLQGKVTTHRDKTTQHRTAQTALHYRYHLLLFLPF